MRVLSLCSGAGGLDLGLRLAVPTARTVCYVEREAYAAAVLAARMEDGALDRAPVVLDLKEFDGRAWRGEVDCVAAGFPCQPVSLAGKQLAERDPRWLWGDVAAIIRDARPPIVFLENVPGLVRNGLDRVVAGLAELGFDAEWSLFSAAGSGAPHLRKRWFLLAAHPDRGGQRSRSEPIEEARRRTDADRGGSMADANGRRLQSERERGLLNGERSSFGDNTDRCCRSVGDANSAPKNAHAKTRPPRGAAGKPGWWSTEPDVGRVAHGVAHRVDRLRATGNGVVPQVAARAWRVLAERITEGR